MTVVLNKETWAAQRCTWILLRGPISFADGLQPKLAQTFLSVARLVVLLLWVKLQSAGLTEFNARP